MAQSKQQIQSLLAQAGSRPRHQFGQNFMIDQNLVRVIADAGELSPGDFVIEVGPGTGTLTEELLSRGAELLAAEIDRDLAELLRQQLGGHPQFRLVEGDVLSSKHALSPEILSAIAGARCAGRKTKLVANLPYNVASPLVIEMLLAGVDVLAFTVQREVADRLRARPSTEDYSTLSVLVQLLSDVELLRTLPPQAFWPAPKIDSALVRLVRRDRLGDRGRPFGAFLQKLFSSRRKMLRKPLAEFHADPEGLLACVGISPQARPEEASPEQLLALFDRLPAAHA